MDTAEPRLFPRAASRNEGVAPEGGDDRAARRAFPGALFARWRAARDRLADAGYGAATVMAYERHAPAIAEAAGPAVAIELADAVSIVAARSVRQAAERLPGAALEAIPRLGDAARLRAWLGFIERFAALAPESAAAILGHTGRLLGALDLARVEAWALTGVRLAGGDPERRLRFFTFADPDAERWLRREAGEVVFADMERRLKAYLTALWRLRAPIREPSSGAAAQAWRRASFDNGVIRLPPSFAGFSGARAEAIFRASLAHIGAHFMYSGAKFPMRSLKPIQVATISLIEDARIEHLAMRDFPGLRRVWRPFHVARASGALIAPSLFARLSRALFEPDFEDPDGWVRKGRELFFSRADDWENPGISREIGGLLGNDLGQLRVQFNFRTYVVEPPYRDDNAGLWDFGDPDQADAEEAELLFEQVRIERRERDDATPPDRERQGDDPDERESAHRALSSRAAGADEGIPVARYPEYDYATGRERADWTTINEYQPQPGPARRIDRILDERPDIVNRITTLIRAARVGRPERLKRQPEGDALDIDACIDAAVSWRVGETPDPWVYTTSKHRHRDLSVLVLLDISESTKDRLRGGRATVLDIERQATALLAHAMDGLGDDFAIAAFRSNRREDVHYYRIKDFDAPYDALARSALAGLEGGLSTRMGAAIRHAGADLRRRPAHRRLLLIVTDGEPSDIDVADRKYLVEDARKAVISLANAGVDCFCVGLDAGGDSYLARIFGRRNAVRIDRLERLPERLPLLYFRLTA